MMLVASLLVWLFFGIIFFRYPMSTETHGSIENPAKRIFVGFGITVVFIMAFVTFGEILILVGNVLVWTGKFFFLPILTLLGWT